VLRAIRNRLRALAPPVIFLAITYYFGWNAVHGKSGLEAQHVQQQQLTDAIARNQAVTAERAAWQTKIADLNGQSIQPDMLDEQARQVLNLANPQDMVIDLAPRKATE
jgi:cell division protein FtsB